MRFLTVKLLAATALSVTLAACVPVTTGPATPAAAVVPPTPPIGANAELYAARADGAFTVPTVPVDKVPESFQRQDVVYETSEAVGTVVISPGEKHLYLVTGKNKATRYGIAVGREGFLWAGEAVVASRQQWPMWTPPPEMIERSPEKAKWKDGMPGGPDNPLGARALYLNTNGVDYGYRIHGTPEWNSIGKNASSGCIRMINQDVMDLYSRVQDGAKVVVLNTDGSYPDKLKLPPKPVVKKKAAKPAVPPTPAFSAAVIIPPTTATPASAAPATTPAPALDSAPAVTVAPTTPAFSAAVVIPPTTPAAPAPAAVTPAPAAVTPAPATTVAPKPCAVPLVNGLCPKA